MACSFHPFNSMSVDINPSRDEIIIDTRSRKEYIVGLQQNQHSKNQIQKITQMKKYVFSFEYEQLNVKYIGTIHLIAEDIVVANRMFDRMYCKEDDRSCTTANHPTICGQRVRVISINEHSNLS